MHRVLSHRPTIAVLVAPGMLLFTAMIFFPTAMSFYYGTTDWSGIGDYRRIGLDNYIQILFHDPTFWRSLGHAVLLAAATVFLQHPVAIFIAAVVSNLGRWEKPLRLAMFVPAVISIVVTSKMWAAVFSAQYGLLNRLLDGVGLSAWKHDWLGDPKTAIWAIIFVVMWQGFGYAFLLYYAGLQRIPDELYEAARIDGASTLKLYTRIVVPLLAPVMRVAIVIAVITCLKQMETVFLMTNGGPGDSTQFLGNYLYTKAFSASQFGYGNALSGLFVLICLAVTIALNRWLSRDVGEF